MGLLACSVLIRNMEPLPGWGSSPWSQAPTANTFRLVSPRAFSCPQTLSSQAQLQSQHRSPQPFPVSRPAILALSGLLAHWALCCWVSRSLEMIEDNLMLGGYRQEPLGGSTHRHLLWLSFTHTVRTPSWVPLCLYVFGFALTVVPCLASPAGQSWYHMCLPGASSRGACGGSPWQTGRAEGRPGAPGQPEDGCSHPLSLMADMGLVTWRECSSREDTVCRCSPGYFCETQEGDHCSTCLPHTTCPRGQRVLKRAARLKPGFLWQGQKQENTVKFPVTEVGLAVTEEETAFNPVNSG
ncbi:tumor necrosis factor receptor superfamily member 14 [Peromyscus maniculatus bairdii]|uniref:tumor necrosis factor receptor superfamily member 14 n=1 Tax=Peromyscus maniculatus bairdii TaxID=230844 RepID=UPI003FD2891F